ncbi:MAG: recombinase RecT [Sphingomonadales bacterium]|nr:recombinase RecT [Sphingomonadales bacterium]
MNAPANVPAPRREIAPIEALKNTVASKADEFKAVLPAHISIEKFQRTIATAAIQNPKLLECDRKSLLMAAMKSANDGLLPDGREAALVPFKVNRKVDGEWQSWWEVQYMPMAWGLRKKVLQSGEVISLETGVVYKAEVESGHFIYEIGMDPPMRYRPKLDLTTEETADDQIVVAFSIARLKNPSGGEPYWSVEVVRRFEIDKIRQMSQTGAVGRTDPRTKRPIDPKGPWVDWFPGMAEKTALRQHTKVLPQSGDLMQAISNDDEEEARARGAARLLEVEPEAPVALPSRDELSGDDEKVDPDTGEIVDEPARDPATGMTQVDEATARALDAGNDGTLSDDNPTAAEGPADEQRGEQHYDDKPVWWAKVQWVRDQAPRAKNKQQLKDVDDEYVMHRANLPDDVIAELDALIANRRRELTKTQEQV